jgi:hypothetical protein
LFHGGITTTVSATLRPYAEKLITKGKKGGLPVSAKWWPPSTIRPLRTNFANIAGSTRPQRRLHPHPKLGPPATKRPWRASNSSEPSPVQPLMR